MNRYEHREVGVYDRQLARVIKVMDPEWQAYHAWSQAGNIPDPDTTPAPVPPPEPTLADVKVTKVLAVEDVAAAQRAKVTAPSSPSEMASWAVKYQQALAYQAPAQGATADQIAAANATAPLLAAEAQFRGVVTQDVVTRVLNNAHAYTAAEARIAGNSGKHKDAIAGLANVNDVTAYDISGGWLFPL